MYRAAAAVQRVANKHEKEMHSLAHAEARKTMQELGYNATSSMNFKSPTGGEFTAGGNKPKEKAAPKGQSSSNEATSTTLFSSGPDTRSKKATPKAKAAPKKAMTTKQAAISAPPVKKVTTKPMPKTTTAKTPPPTSVKSRKVK
jgi:Tfp pilus assembly major pilin PilA